MRLSALFAPQSLTGRVFALFAGTLICFLGISAGLFYRYEFTSGIQDSLDAARVLSEVVTPTVTDSVVIGDHDTVQRTLAKAIQNSPFSSVSLIDLAGGTLKVERNLSYVRHAPEWLRNAVDDRLGDINNVIAVGGRDYGVLRFRFAPDLIAAELWKVTGVALALASTVLLAALAVIRFSLRRWLEPLERIGQGNWDRAATDSDQRLVRDAPVEVRETLKAFARAGAELQVQRLTAAATLDAVNEGVVTADRDGKILYANPAASSLLRVSAKAALGRALSEVLPEAFVASHLPNGFEPRDERLVEIAGSAGERVILNTTLAPIPGATGEVIGQVLTLRDVTVTRAYEQILREELKKRRSATQALREAIRDMIPESELGSFAGSDTDLESVARLFTNLAREREASQFSWSICVSARSHCAPHQVRPYRDRLTWPSAVLRGASACGHAAGLRWIRIRRAQCRLASTLLFDCTNPSQSPEKRKGPASLQALESVARPAGFEPTTPWFVAKYSIQLSYGRVGRELYMPAFAHRSAGITDGLFRTSAPDTTDRHGPPKSHRLLWLSIRRAPRSA